MNRSIAFIVDGHMEQKIVQHFCPGIPVRRPNCNGDNVPVATLAKHIAPLVRLLKRVRKFFVIVDREGRAMSAAKMEADIKAELAKLEVDISCVVVSVADRSTENWMLADVEGLKVHPYLREDVKQEDYEGKNGKSALQKLFKPDISYHETTVGVDLFKCVRPKIAGENSKSFRMLIEELEPYCPSLSPEKGTC